MWKLNIVNFRQHRNLNLEFDELKTILIKGVSGSGKTTVLESITWLLYGKLRNVHGDDKNSTFVTLKNDDIEIGRCRQPTKLYFKDKDNVWNLNEAQSKIDEYFGIFNMFNISSYCRQKEMNNFLQMSVGDRVDFLNNLVFDNDDPDIIINKINDKLNYCKSEMNNMISQWNSQSAFIKQQKDMLLSQRYEVINDINNIQVDYSVTSEELTNLLVTINELRSLQNMKIKLQNQLSVINVKEIDNINDIQENINKCNLEKMKKQADIDNYNKEKTNYSNWLYQQQQIKILEKEIENVKAKITPNILNIDVKEHERYWYEYDNFINWLKQCNFDIHITEECFNSYLLESKQMLDEQYLLKKRNDAIRLINELQLDENVTIDFINNTIKTLEEKINHHILSKQSFKCPKCDSLVKLIENRLFPIECPDIDKVKNIDPSEIKIQLSKYNQLLILLPIKNVREQYNVNIIQARNITQPNIKYIRKPNIPRRQINEINNNNINIMKLNHLEQSLENINKIKLDIPSIIDEKSYIETNHILSTLIDKINKLNISLKNNQQQEQINNRADLIKEQLTKYDKDYDSEINNLLIREKYLKDELTKLQLVNSKQNQVQLIDNQILNINKDEEQLTILQNNIIERNKLVSKINKALEIAEQLKHEMIEDFSNDLSNKLNFFLDLFFDDPIQAEIKGFRQLKSTKSYKNSMDLEITHRNRKTLNTDGLCGGEKDRISLAFTLSMNKLVSSKFLFLDETLSSIDQNSKTNCLNYIKQYFPQTTVIVVLHDANEGFFDQMISL